MDGIELGRQIARLRVAGRAQARIAFVWRGHPEDTAATAADCVRSAKEPLRRFDALRRRPGPNALEVRWPARPTGSPLTRER